MYVNRTKKNPYTKQTVFDVLSAVVGLAVIAVGIVSFINLEKNAWLFPVVFLLAAIFQCLRGNHNKQVKRLSGILLMLGVVSALCLWR